MPMLRGMHRSRWWELLGTALAVVLATSLALCVGCAPGAGGPAGPDFGRTPTDPNYGAPIPTGPLSPTGSAAASDIEEALRELEICARDAPVNRARIQELAARFADMVKDDPTDAGAQLGLALCSLAIAADEAAQRIGYDLDTNRWVAPLIKGDLRAALSVCTRAVEVPARVVHIGVPGGTAGTGIRQATIPGTQSTLQDMWAGADVLLGWLGQEEPAAGIIGRLARIAAMTDTIITVKPCDTEIAIEPWMVQLVLAAVHAVRGALLSITAYNPDIGTYVPLPEGEDLNQLDSNGDGTLDPVEYLPPDPFLTLQSDGRARLEAASDSMHLMTVWLERVVTALESEGLPPQIELDAPPDWEGIRCLLEALDAVRTRAVEFELYLWDAGQQQFRTDTFRLNFGPLFGGQLADLKDYTPPLAGPDWQPTGFPDPTFGGVMPDGMYPEGGWGIARVDGCPIPWAAPVIGTVLVSDWTLHPGETSEITVIAYDPQGGDLTYAFSCEEGQGTIVGNGNRAIYTAPDVSSPTNVMITMTVTNSAGFRTTAYRWLSLEPTP